MIKLPYPSASILSSLFEPSSSDNNIINLSFINNYTACVIQALIVWKSFRKNKTLSEIFSCINIKTKSEIQ